MRFYRLSYREVKGESVLNGAVGPLLSIFFVPPTVGGRLKPRKEGETFENPMTFSSGGQESIYSCRMFRWNGVEL